MLRKKAFSFINIVGLSIGLTCCILIFLYVKYELSFDSFHTRADRIYRVVNEAIHPDGTNYSESTPFPMAEAMRNDFPELEEITRIFHTDEALISIDKKLFKEKSLVFVESRFFEKFHRSQSTKLGIQKT